MPQTVPPHPCNWAAFDKDSTITCGEWVASFVQNSMPDAPLRFLTFAIASPSCLNCLYTNKMHWIARRLSVVKGLWLWTFVLKCPTPIPSYGHCKPRDGRLLVHVGSPTMHPQRPLRHVHRSQRWCAKEVQKEKPTEFRMNSNESPIQNQLTWKPLKSQSLRPWIQSKLKKNHQSFHWSLISHYPWPRKDAEKADRSTCQRAQRCNCSRRSLGTAWRNMAKLQNPLGG